jgi:hypothetical protein
MDLIRLVTNFLMSPPIFFTLASALFFVALFAKRPWTDRWGAIVGGGGVLLYGLAMLEPNFRRIVAKPDNVPITMVLFITGFFTWFSMREALRNDARLKEGLPPVEKAEEYPKVLTWPDLVYIEFIAMILGTVILIAWAILLEAPIEEPANPARTPNPSKAPWYFLGLQEMLVYYDPWIAGVVLPGLIIVGLIAIPYIDRNPKGNGYFTFAERKFAVATFLFGFLVLWVSLIIFGTFLRGPNWNFFGPFEYWDVHKLVPLTNVNFSEIIWVKMLGTGLPKNFFFREIFGFLAVLLYFTAVPVLLTRTIAKGMREQLGAPRYWVTMFLFLIMLALPIKMYLRWLFNLKYIIAIPEFFFNI